MTEINDKKTTPAAPPVPGHESYGSEKRDEVGGGPAGRGNDGESVANTGRDWGRGDKQGIKEQAAPPGGDGTPKNPFSK